MKREVKQVWTGISRSITSAAAAAELTGNVSLNLVGFANKARKELLLQCSSSELERKALQKLLAKNTADSQIAAGEMAAEQLWKKWNSEE